jgi:DNA-binding transcriptional MocR family regulator
MAEDKRGLPERTSRGHWVQTERAAHEAWAALLRASPRAAELLHLLVARMGDHNAVIMSQGTMAQLMGRNRRTVQRAIEVLTAGHWIEARQIGDRGTVCAYIINDRVAWQGKRDGLRYSLFSAAVVVSEEEQPDQADLGDQEPLKKLPSLFPGERQLPSGNGLAPPSEPDLPGMEPDLPAREVDRP